MARKKGISLKRGYAWILEFEPRNVNQIQNCGIEESKEKSGLLSSCQVGSRASSLLK